MEQQTSKKRRLSRTWWFWTLIAVVVVLAICGGAVLADWLVYYDEVHAGITVEGVYLRGMTEEQAVAAVNRLIDTVGPVTLTNGDKTWTVTPADVGRAIDVQAVVAQAMAISRSGDFFQDVVKRFQLYRHAEDLPLTVSVDQAKIQALVKGLATQLHVTPLNAQLWMENGHVKVTEGVNGQDVDTSALSGSIASVFLSLRSASLEVPLIVKEPDVQVEDNLPAQRQAETMMSSPITLTDRDKSWTLTPLQLASWLDFRTDYTNGVPTLVPYISEGRMQMYLMGLAPEVYKKPVNAGFKSDGTKPIVVPAVDGEVLDPTATTKLLNEAAVKPGGRSVAVAVTLVEPAFTTAEAKATKFDDQLSTFTTKYVCPANRQQNVRITTKYATNVFLAPGQEYNFDRQIGPRTEARGYKLAPGITGPNTLEDVLGGGICQVSTTMFNAVFFAGLKVTERHNHSIFINHYPLGRDATVTSGGKNLRFVNDTGHYIWIRGTSDGITTTISIYGTSDGRKVSYTVGKFYNIKNPTTITVNDPTLPAGTTKVVDNGQQGRQLKTNRVVTLPDGTVIHNNTWISTWPMYPIEVHVGTKTT